MHEYDTTLKLLLQGSAQRSLRELTGVAVARSGNGVEEAPVPHAAVMRSTTSATHQLLIRRRLPPLPFGPNRRPRTQAVTGRIVARAHQDLRCRATAGARQALAVCFDPSRVVVQDGVLSVQVRPR